MTSAPCSDCEEYALLDGRCWECHQRNRKRQRKVSRKNRDAVFDRDGGKCVYCGCVLLRHRHPLRCSYAESAEYWEIDHRTPVDSGGTNHVANLQLTCSGCNQDKGTRNDKEYRALLESRELAQSRPPKSLEEIREDCYHRRRQVKPEEAESITTIMQRTLED